MDGDAIATLVVHVVFDYRTLPFISSQSAYFDVFSDAGNGNPLEGPPAGDVEFTVYGWGLTRSTSRRPKTRGRSTMRRSRASTHRSRQPFWTVLHKSRQRYNVYFANDRQFIYALGYATAGAFDHLVRLAELTTLAAVGYVLVLMGNALFTRSPGRARRPAGRCCARSAPASIASCSSPSSSPRSFRCSPWRS